MFPLHHPHISIEILNLKPKIQNSMGRAGIAPATKKGRFYRSQPTLIGEPTHGICSMLGLPYYINQAERTGFEPARGKPTLP